MDAYYIIFLFVCNFFIVFGLEYGIAAVTDPNYMKTNYFVYWPNATVPFYITPEHFDAEQSLAIIKTLSMFAFKTCIKFSPAMSAPTGNQHVMTFVNPEGIRRCVFETDGHSIDELHFITLGYDCMESPNIEMTIMKALGFPFEHIRVTRDLFIEVLPVNIEPAYMDLFTKGVALPPELRALPYDYKSVMHFGERDFSKNGHRTILIKDHRIVQNRGTLTPTDLKKIEIVYGPECQKRDRQEKIDLCQGYPGVARRKRHTDNHLHAKGKHEASEDETNNDLINLLRVKRHSLTQNTDDIRARYHKSSAPDIIVRRRRSLPNELSNRKSLRVNPNITPPPEILTNLTDSLTELGIQDQIEDLIEKVHKVTSLALKATRDRYCNTSDRPVITIKRSEENTADIVGIVEMVAEYVKTVVDTAMSNMTAFCESPDAIESYVRQSCAFNDGLARCRPNYRSTKSGPVRHSTNYKPHINQPTRHEGRGVKHQFDKVFRSGNSTEEDTEVTTEMSKKTDVVTVTTEAVEKHSDKKEVRRKREVKQESGEDTDVLAVDKDTRWAKMKMTGKPKGGHFNKKSRKHGDSSSPENWDSSKVSLEMNKDKPYSEAEVVKDDERGWVKGVEDSESEQMVKDVKSSPERSKKKVRKDKYREKNTRIQLPKTVPLSKANEEFYTDRMWPKGIVRYVINNEPQYDLDDLRARLREINNILQKKTCTRLKELTEKAAENYEDYLVLDTSQDYVTGKVGGKQHFGSIELFQGNQHKQHTAMMVMAMLGFYFEVSRHDRDKYIRVHSRHIRADKLHHFEKIRDDATLALPYDYKSATHPAWQFWRKIGKTGISTVATYKEQDPDGKIMKTLGQNEQLLSDIDIIKINSVYGVECFKKQRAMNIETKAKERQENVFENVENEEE